MKVNTSAKPSALYFNELAPIRDDDVVLAGHLYSLEFEDDPFSRLMICRDGKRWNHLGDIDSIVSSVVAYLNDAGRAVVLGVGRTGETLTIDSAGVRIGAIPMDPGFLFQARRVGDAVYACGSQRQVWRLRGDQWTRVDAGLAVARQDKDNPILYCLGGVSERCLYAGGRMGELYFSNGTAWTAVDSPTSQDIERIEVVSEDEVYFCGKGGTLYRGRDGEWEMIGDPDSTETYWGLAWFKGRIYVSSVSHLFVHDGSTLQPVAPPPAPAFAFHRLAASSRYLWATGGDGTVARWDGSEWQRFLCPDNA